MTRRSRGVLLAAAVWLAWPVAETTAQVPLEQQSPESSPRRGARPPSDEFRPFTPEPGPVVPPTLPTPGPYPIPIPGPPVPPPAGLPVDWIDRQLGIGGFVLIPTLLVTEEYNDNIFSNNAIKKADYITSFSPGLIVGLRDPRYDVTLGYSFTSQIYARETELTDALARQVATLDGGYRFDPTLGVRLAERYSRDNNTSATALPSISTGRVDSWTNVVTPSAVWDATALTRVHAAASWQRTRLVDRPPSGVSLSDFDIYGFLPGVEYRFLPRLTGLADFEFALSDVAGETTSTFAGLVGVRYQITPTLQGSVRLGPQYATEGNVGTSLAASVSLTQSFRWGAAFLTYDRRNSVVGGFTGTAETNVVGAGLVVTGLLRDLSIGFTGGYVTANESTLIDTNAFNLSLTGSYRLTTWLTAVAAYNFFFQRSSGTLISNDVDQNRVLLGLQLTYPYRRD